MRRFKAVAAILAMVLLAGLTATGCTTSNAGRDNQGTSSYNTPTTKETGPELSVTPGGADRSSGLTSQEFVNQASVANMAEIQMAELALKNGGRAEVKELAQHILTDHRAAGEKLTSIARRDNLSVPTELDSDHQDKLKELQGARGADFDDRYVSMQIDAHEQAVDLFTRASTDVSGPLQTFAKETLPKLQSHLSHATEIDKTISAGDEDDAGAGGPGKTMTERY